MEVGELTVLLFSFCVAEIQGKGQRNLHKSAIGFPAWELNWLKRGRDAFWVGADSIVPPTPPPSSQQGGVFTFHLFFYHLSPHRTKALFLLLLLYKSTTLYTIQLRVYLVALLPYGFYRGSWVVGSSTRRQKVSLYSTTEQKKEQQMVVLRRFMCLLLQQRGGWGHTLTPIKRPSS